ncbi:MAG: hypothetical protein LBI11_06115 [Streptococcaceae bacterium]|jgi:hypothetical protein|nr:hypothetical protein [Streptococcaceae bacterium]
MTIAIGFQALAAVCALSVWLKQPVFLGVDQVLLWSKLTTKITASRALKIRYTLIWAVIFQIGALVLYIARLAMKTTQLAILVNPVFWGIVLASVILIYSYQGRLGGN